MKEVTTTAKAITLINLGIFNKKELSEELGITRPTLDTRLSRVDSWKKLEIKWINYLHNKNVIV